MYSSSSVTLVFKVTMPSHRRVKGSYRHTCSIAIIFDMLYQFSLTIIIIIIIVPTFFQQSQ